MDQNNFDTGWKIKPHIFYFSSFLYITVEKEKYTQRPHSPILMEKKSYRTILDEAFSVVFKSETMLVTSAAAARCEWSTIARKEKVDP